MSWKENFSTDVVSIDQQHHDLIAALEAFFVKVHAGLGKAALVDGLDEVIELVANHFDHEERIMRNVALPGLMVHESLHRALLEELCEFREEVAMGGLERNAADVEHFLNAWLYRHILDEDLKISRHLNRS